MHDRRISMGEREKRTEEEVMDQPLTAWKDEVRGTEMCK